MWWMIIGAIVAYLVSHAHLYWNHKRTAQSHAELKALIQAVPTQANVNLKLDEFDRQRTDFLVEKMLWASKTAGVLCRVCDNCRLVVHKYDLKATGEVRCHDCKTAGIK
jgi:hypothetical protein